MISSPEYEDDVDFNLFIFTQWWPQTQCYQVRMLNVVKIISY